MEVLVEAVWQKHNSYDLQTTAPQTLQDIGCWKFARILFSLESTRSLSLITTGEGWIEIYTFLWFGMEWLFESLHARSWNVWWQLNFYTRFWNLLVRKWQRPRPVMLFVYKINVQYDIWELLIISFKLRNCNYASHYIKMKSTHGIL